MRAAGNPVFVDMIIGVFQMCAFVQWNIRLLKVPVLAESISREQILVNLYGIEGGITEKGFGVDQRMRFEKIRQCRDQQSCVMNGLVFVRGICFLLNDDFRMVLKKSLL